MIFFWIFYVSSMAINKGQDFGHTYSVTHCTLQIHLYVNLTYIRVLMHIDT